MNSRKAAKTVPATVSRLLKSGAFLKRPPPAFYPTLAHPPPPSLVRSLPLRDPSDLPPTSSPPPTPYQVARRKLAVGEKLSSEEEEEAFANPQSRSTTRRRPPRPANSKRSRPLPIVFREDEIRRQFFRDHPFEAYRPQILAEGEQIAEERGPSGLEWTALMQRTKVPTAEDAIAFTENLHTTHGLSLPQAYSTSLSQFRTLRAEHEIATRAATAQAQAHGAVFFGEIQRGVLVEEKVLDEWVRAREIQADYAAKVPGAVVGASSSSEGVAGGNLGGLFGRTTGESAGEGTVAEAPFTGGVDYVRHFSERGVRQELEQGEDSLAER